MIAVQLIITAICGLALLALAPALRRAWRRGERFAWLCAACAVCAAALLAAALLALALGADHWDTGRFLMGLGVGIAVGLTLGCIALLAASQRSKADVDG